jgi:hypothetical protein
MVTLIVVQPSAKGCNRKTKGSWKGKYDLKPPGKYFL